MATNDEKRRVAAELRESIPDGNFPKGKKGWGVLYLTLFGHYMPNQRSAMTYREVASRLAELIEPDTTTDTTKSPDVTTKCDRHALLKLANRIQHHADNAAGFSTYAARFDLAGWAEVIREACGEMQDD